MLKVETTVMTVVSVVIRPLEVADTRGACCFAPTGATPS